VAVRTSLVFNPGEDFSLRRGPAAVEHIGDEPEQLIAAVAVATSGAWASSQAR
jgi:hypothetical protein